MENLSLLKCKNCGAELDEREAVNGVIKCKYCHTPWPVPKKETTSEALRYIHSGYSSLDVCKFDDAFTYFQKASELDKQEPEAYFGMALASFCVQYLKDEVNDCLQPICHEISDKMFTDDKNYRKALEFATMEQKRIYRRRGQEIDEIRDEFFALKKSGLDFDCFICVKVTEEDGHRRTQDYDRANDIYYHLKDCDYKPFFSEREMKGRTGAAYEALILYALYTSECMLIVCSNEEYLQTKWVKNEYTRFMSMLANHEKDRDAITFVFNGTPIERLPNGRKIQGIDYTKPDAYTRLTDFVNKHTPEAAQKREEEKLRKQREEEARNRLIEEQAKQLEEQKRLIEEQNKRFGEMMNNFSSSNISSASNSTQVDHNHKESVSQKQIDEKYQKGLALYNNKDYTSALPYFIDAANHGHADSQCTLGVCYENGRGVTQNYSKAVEWYTKAANQGMAEAQYNLAIAYESGTGVAKNLNVAMQWYEKAAKQGLEVAKKKLEKEKKERQIINDFEIVNGELKKYKGNDANVTIPDSVTAIGDESFWGCKNLTNITIPGKVKTIGENAFMGCTSLISVTIPNSVTSIGAFAFKGCTSLISVTIPDIVTTIGEGAFGDCTNLTSVTIPDSVTTIGECAFWNCASLTSITIPNSVTSIDEGAFSGCTNLTSLTILGNVKSIGELAFYNCPIETASIPAIAIEDIKNSNLKIAVITSGDSIADGACENCTSLISLTISNCVTSIGAFAFAECENLTSVTIPNSVTSIGAFAFRGCISLTAITIPNGVDTIGKCAFWDCTSLTSVNIPNSVTSIEEEAFRTCTSIESITVDNDNKYYRSENNCLIELKTNSLILGCNNSIIPNGIKSIDNCAFMACENLTSVTIPHSVTSIGVYAFNGCTNIKCITIPNSVTSIGKGAFDGCLGLTSVTIPQRFKGFLNSGLKGIFSDSYKYITFTFI